MRLRRSLFTLLAAGSLVLSATSVVLWVRSYQAVDDARAAVWDATEALVDETSFGAWSAEGRLSFWYSHRIRPPYDPRVSGLPDLKGSGKEWSYGRQPWRNRLLDSARWFWFWSEIDNTTGERPGATRTRIELWIPHGALAGVFSLVPATWMWCRRLTRRVRAGFCRACGYDLRATSGRCPECGSAAERTLTPPKSTHEAAT